MSTFNEKVEVARITSRQAVLVAAVTAIAGIATGYFGTQASHSGEAGENSSKISALEVQIQNLQKDLVQAQTSETKARNDLASLKQRVRDILGPKEDKIKQMSTSLERMKGDSGISQDHRERLTEIVADLDKIDNKVLGIVE